MSRLNESFHPLLTSTVLSKLFQKSIYTSLSFVCTNPELLAKITELQYSKVLQIKDSILTKFSSTLKHGDKFYREFLNHCAIVPSGIENLDKLLDGGFMTGNIYELCGFSGCGKTQICMTTAVNICSSSEQQVFFIDTKNDLSAQRIFQIIDNLKITEAGEIMHRIQTCYVTSAQELLTVLHHLETKISCSKEKYIGFRVIIIDSLSALFQAFNDQAESLSMLNIVANFIKFLSAEYHLVVLLTNFVTSWTSDMTGSGEDDDEDGGVFQQVEQPALGKYWAHVPNTRIMVKKLDASNDCFLIVLKSLCQPMGKTVKVTISDAGVS